MREDYTILGEMLDAIIEHKEQPLRPRPKRGYPSPSRKVRLDVEAFTEECRNGTLKGRARKRRALEVFRKVMSLCPDHWK